MIRQTFDGRIVDTNEISHQHLSNIYWFNKIFNLHFPEINYEIKKLLDEKWESVILPYCPHHESKEELAMLERLGYLEWFEDNGIRKAKIYDIGSQSYRIRLLVQTDGCIQRLAPLPRKQIGEFCHPSWIRHEKLDTLSKIIRMNYTTTKDCCVSDPLRIFFLDVS